MKDASPYIAITALLVTLGGALYGWATTQGSMQTEVTHLRTEVTALQQQTTSINTEVQQLRLDLTRWIAANERTTRR